MIVNDMLTEGFLKPLFCNIELIMKFNKFNTVILAGFIAIVGVINASCFYSIKPIFLRRRISKIKFILPCKMWLIKSTETIKRASNR